MWCTSETAKVSNDRTDHEHRQDDGEREGEYASGERSIEGRGNNRVEKERGDDGVDVQLDERAEIELADSVEQPPAAEHHKDWQKNLDENGPKQHRQLVGACRLKKQPSAEPKSRAWLNQP